MKKTISMMLAVVLCMGLFTGCGDKSPKPPKEVTEIVEAVNKELVSSRKTEKENFELTEAFTLEGMDYFVYESNGIYKENGKEYRSTMKFECENGEFKLLTTYKNQDFGLNLAAIAYVMEKEKEGEYLRINASPNKSEYIKSN